PAGRFLVAHDLEAGAFGLPGRGRARAQRDRDVLHAAVAQVLRVGVALAAVAEHGDLLVGDQVQVGVGVVINLHVSSYSKRVMLNSVSIQGATYPAPCLGAPWTLKQVRDDGERKEG